MAGLLESARRHWRNAYGRLRQIGDDRVPVMSLVVALMLGVVLGLGLGRWWLQDGSGTEARSDRAQLSEGTDRRPGPEPVRAGRQDTTSGRLGRCEAVYAAQVRPLRAVGPAMSQWEVHIGAMNKLVVGAISLAQATTFWNQTREGAARNVAEFAGAQRAYHRRTTRCSPPGKGASDELRRCADVVAARDRELRRAAEALDSWGTHVRHMEMLRRGELSPAEATSMWLESWREGTLQVDAYRSAARAVDRATRSHQDHHGGAEGPCAG